MTVSVHPNPSSGKDSGGFHNFSFLPVTILFKLLYSYNIVQIPTHKHFYKKIIAVLNQIPVKAENTNTAMSDQQPQHVREETRMHKCIKQVTSISTSASD